MLLQRKYFIILLFVHLAKAINVVSPNIRNNGDISEVSRCIVNIIQTNKLYKPTLGIYENNMENNDLHYFIKTTILDVAVENTIPITTISNTDYANVTKYTHYGSFIIIMYVAICQSLIDITDGHFNVDIKYIIVLHDYVVSNCNDSLQDSTRNIAKHDVTFIYKDKTEGIFKLATYIPIIDATTCKSDNDFKFTHINACINGSIVVGTIENVFPVKKSKNWMGCPLNVGIGSLYPYSTVYDKNLPNLHPLEVAGGSDVEIMKIVANYFNASPNFYHIKTDPENILLEVSFISLLLNGTLDICAGGLYRLFGDVVSYSGIYSKQAVIWIYTVERENRSWLTFIHKIDGLYIFVIFYFCYSVLWAVFCYFDEQTISFSNTMLYGWGTLLGTASLQDARNLKKKILNMFYLLMCLHLSVFVSIQLYSFLTIQGPPYVYKDTTDISTSGRPLYMKNKAKHFIDDEKYATFANTSYNCNDFSDCITKTLSNKGITAILDGLYPPIQADTAEKDEAKIVKVTEDILVVYHEMLIRKESSLVGNFEKVVARLFESGICQKLFDDSLGILIVDKARRVNQNIMSNSYSCELGCKISLSDSAGAFYVWMVGCAVSFCVFCVEILNERNRK